MPPHAERLNRRARAATAAALLSGPWEYDAMVARIRTCEAVTDDWVETVATRAYETFPRPPLDAPGSFASWLSTIAPEPGFFDLFEELADEGDVERLLDAHLAWVEQTHREGGPRNREGPVWQTPRSRPAAPQSMGPMPWIVPSFASVADLADAWDESVDALRWLADRPSMARTRSTPPEWNYRYRWMAKRAGGWRLIEAPRPRLARLQRRLLHEVLDQIPVHPCAYGFVAGRSVADFAAPHVGRGLVVRIDLEDFFPSVSASRVYGVFRGAGYPESIAHLFTAVATTRTPPKVRSQARVGSGDASLTTKHRRMLDRLGHTHLPQGAPTSPALANLAAFRLDQRLSGLARHAKASYTRYADDLVFSWPAEDADHVAVDRWVAAVGRLVADERLNVARPTRGSASEWVVGDTMASKRRRELSIESPTIQRMLRRAAPLIGR